MNGKLVLLFVLTLVIYSLPAVYMHTAKAIAVGGDITENTTWTTVDSPYVVTSDITIYANATLQIEAGTEIKFDGYYRITVNGNLTATGTNSSKIRFTSNKPQPTKQDWAGIEMNNGKALLLKWCIIEYAINAINIVGNQSTSVENSIFQNIKTNAIHAISTSDIFLSQCDIIKASLSFSNTDFARVTNCSFYNCQWGLSGGGNSMMITHNVFDNSSISVFSGSNITISRNTLKGPGAGYGIVSSPGGEISYNRVHGFSRGMLIGGYGKSVHHNIVYSNTYGIYIHEPWPPPNSTNAILNNSICYNGCGIYCEFGANMQIHFNDVYSNLCGENVTLGATTNSTLNYWGDLTGPYHISMNPTAKGNPAVGNETHLRFIPFLSAPTGHINQPPIAVMSVDNTNPAINETVTFNASNSTDDGKVDFYFFNFGDGTNSSWTHSSAVTHKYSQEGQYNATLVVIDDFGVTSSFNGSVHATIIVVPELLPLLILSILLVTTLPVAMICRKKLGISSEKHE